MLLFLTTNCYRKILNLVFLFVIKIYMSNKMPFVFINIMVLMLNLLLVLLSITNIWLQKYQLLIYKSYADIKKIYYLKHNIDIFL